MEADTLVLYSGGGSAHFRAAEALAKKQTDKGRTSVCIDIFEHCLGPISDMCVNRWNKALGENDPAAIQALVEKQPIADRLFHPMYVQGARRLFESLDSEPEEIIITTPMAINGVIRALHQQKQLRGWKNVKLKVYLTELPTDQARYILDPLRRLSLKGHRNLVELCVPCQPLLEEGESQDEWWEKRLGGPGIKVTVLETPPIRKAFRTQEDLLGKAVNLEISPSKEGGDPTRMSIQKSDRVCTMMLGSQVNKNAVPGYVKQYKNAVGQLISCPENVDRTYYFFAYVGAQERGNKQNALLRQLQEMQKEIEQDSDLQGRCKLVPFTHQSDTTLAPLLARSDMTITRTGGMTSIELTHLNRDVQRATYIHAENFVQNYRSLWRKIKDIILFILQKIHLVQLNQAKLSPERVSHPDQQYLDEEIKKLQLNFTGNNQHELEQEALQQIVAKRGQPCWEAANALYLSKTIGAGFTTPGIAERAFLEGLARDSSSLETSHTLPSAAVS